jgi:hypothetical protein
MQKALKQSADKKYFSVGLPPFVPFEVFPIIRENSSPSKKLDFNASSAWSFLEYPTNCHASSKSTGYGFID